MPRLPLQDVPNYVQHVPEASFARWFARMAGQVISPGGAAAICGCSRNVVYDWAKTGLVRAWTTRRGEFYVHVGDVVQVAKRKGFRVAPEWSRRGFAKDDE